MGSTLLTGGGHWGQGLILVTGQGTLGEQWRNGVDTEDSGVDTGDSGWTLVIG